MKKNETHYITRRNFLKLAGLTAGGATAGHFLFSDLMAVPQKVLEKVARGTGKETWVNTVCGQCPGGCGISVRRIDGIPIYIKGNPIFPVNRGGVCPMAHTSMEVLFNPDRVKNPLKRLGTKGRGDWENVSWELAQNSLSEKLQPLISKGEGYKIAMINGDNSPLMRALSQYWMKRIGSPNYFEDENLLENSTAVQLSQGIKDIPVYDLTNSKYILNFGSNFLEEGLSPVYYQQLYSHLRTPRREKKAILVQIDSQINLTGSSADRWIPIHPGTHGALSLGIAYILIVNELYDKDFIQKNTFGFSPFKDKNNREHMGFKSFVKSNYYPEKVSEITGVPAEMIILLGKEFGTHKPAVAISDDASRYTTNGSFSQWAVYCLNAMIGNIQKKGGIYFTPPTPEFHLPELSLDKQTQKSLSHPKVGSEIGIPSIFGDVTIDQFAEAIISTDDDLIETLIIIDSNPVFNSRNKETIRQALHKIKNVIYLGLFVDETAKHCDYIFPVHSYLEKMDISGPKSGLIFSHIGLQRPVISPVFDTKQAGDILIESGESAIGSQHFPWKSYKDLVRKRLESLYKSGEGAVISKSSDAEWIKYLKARGWKVQQYETFKSFQKLLVKNGGWWNPIDPARLKTEIFQTKTKKFEFYSSTLEKALGEKAINVEGSTSQEKHNRLLSSLHISARGDDLLLPHHEILYSLGRPEEFPLLLTVSQLLTNRDGKGASQPSMMEMVGIQIGKHWKSWIEINPNTAREYGLRESELAWVESSNGRIQAEVRIFPGIRPGIIHMALGMGHTSYGRFGTGIGANVTDLIENNYDSLSNTPALNGTRVKVSRVLTGV